MHNKFCACATAIVLLAITAGCGKDEQNGTPATTTVTTTAPAPAPATTTVTTAPPTTATTSPAPTDSTTAKPAAKAKPAKAAAGAKPSGKVVTTSDGLQYQDLIVGTGASPQPGQTVTVKYVGTLTNGTKFDASTDHPGPGTFDFTIGQGQVIKGWDEGVMSMKIGGKRKLIVPPALGYGPNGQGPIPPNSTLIFVVDLISTK